MNRDIPHYILLITILLVAVSCIKTEEVDDNMNQSFSVPIGEKALKIDAPTIIDNNSTFYYNGKPYLIPGPYFKKEDVLDFQIDTLNRIDLILGIDFRIRISNSYPANAYLQIYLLDPVKMIVDSFFVTGPEKIPAGEVDKQSDPSVISTKVLDSEFHGERLTKLKKAEFIKYLFYLETKRDDGAVLRFSHNCDIKVNLAMRLHLKYNLNEL